MGDNVTSININKFLKIQKQILNILAENESTNLFALNSLSSVLLSILRVLVKEKEITKEQAILFLDSLKGVL